MKSMFNLQSIKDFFKKEKTLIILIIILAYLLRVLPYLSGYSIPFTEDGIRDFQQVKYLIDNNKINFTDSYYNYGAFPVLHLLVFGISKLGFDPLKVFLFIPQIFPSLGILFFYLFLKKYLSVKHSLLACFLISVFGPHIHWSSQPIRETIGLFFFPLIIYLFDREMTDENVRKGILNKILLAISMVLMILSHHWSNIMIIGWLLFYSLFFLKSNKKLPSALLVIGAFLILSLTYWYFAFSLAFTLVATPFRVLSLISLIIGVFFIAGIFLLRRFNLNKIKNNHWRFISLALLTLLLLIILGKKLIPLDYPLQIWMMFFIFLIFAFVGFFHNREQKMNDLALINIFYLIFWIIALSLCIFKERNLAQMPFDPFRTLEFAIFSVAPIAAAGFLTINKKIAYLMPISVIILIFLATLIYPPIFIYKNSFANTIFYDIRSDIRYIPDDTRDLIHWANEHGYNVTSNIPEIRSYQATFYPTKKKKLALITTSDYSINENYHYINDPILRNVHPEQWFGEIDDSTIIYSNEKGYLIPILRNSRFISQGVPQELTPEEQRSVSITIKNTGSEIWVSRKEGGHFLGSQNPQDNQIWRDGRILLPGQIFPGQIVEFTFDITAPDTPGTYDFQWRMVKEYVEWFGEFTPNVEIMVVAPN